jgi:hypothetical protein
VFGLKEKLVTAERDIHGTASGFGRETIRPYKCALRVKGEDGQSTTCGRPALRKTERHGKWRCSQHSEPA